MSSDALKDRKDALENEFFVRENAKAVEALRAKLSADASREALAEASGISDASVIDGLVEAGITAETLAALSLVPLVAVAWADGKLDPGERDAIERAAESANLSADHQALLAEWLGAAPGAGLLDAWKAYVAALREGLDADSLAALRQTIVGGARSVAESAGGFLGLGNKVSNSEAAVLADLEACFDA